MTAARPRDAYRFALHCIPAHVWRELDPADRRHLDTYCARAMDDPHARPQPGDEAAAVARYHRVLDERPRPRVLGKRAR